MLTSAHPQDGAAPGSAVAVRPAVRGASPPLRIPPEKPRPCDEAPTTTAALVDALIAKLAGRDTLVPLAARAIARELGLSDEARHRAALAALLAGLGSGPGEEIDPARAAEHVDALLPVTLAFPGGRNPLPEVLAAVAHREERWDGQGRPDGLAGKRIPLLARILAVAGAFVATIRPRAHPAACHAAAVMEELTREAGAGFDPDVVAAAERALLAAPGAGEGSALSVAS